MAPLCPRFHLFEINDQPWFPDFLREKVQSCLTLAWVLQVRPLQSRSPAHLVASTLLDVVPSRKAPQYTFVDFCAGAGGPTPTIELAVNAQLATEAAPAAAQFVLTDLHPHREAWLLAAKKSDHLGYVSQPVDAAAAPRDLLKGRKGGAKVFRLFNLAFHHFDDPLAAEIMRNTIETADGFGIFELQDRTFESFLTITGLGLLLFLITPFYFWRSPSHLFFTYIIPIIPFVVTFDGYVSSLRTRTAEEVLALLPKSATGAHKDWEFKSGRAVHTWPAGNMSFVMGVKKDV